MTTTYLYRLRVAFPGQTRPLLETGRLMARWAEAAARIVAPELDWQSAVDEHADYSLAERWQASHVVRLSGTDAEGVERGRGDSRLRAGGKRSRIGGTGRVVVTAVGPSRALTVDNHCDVEHWDLRVGPITREALDALVEALEEEIGAEAELSNAREEEATPGPQIFVRDAAAGDVDTWLRDLAEARIEATHDDGAIVLEAAALPDVDALFAARVTVGEILAEAGHDDWEERALDVLLRLPAAESARAS